MRRLVRSWGVSLGAWAAIVLVAGAALAGGEPEPVEPEAWISPGGVVEGKTLDSDEPFEMTVHLQAEVSSVYDLAVSYGGDAVGTCQAEQATLQTNPQGKDVWTCELDVAENTGEEPVTGTVTFTVTQDAAPVDEVVATLTVRPAEVVETVDEVEAEPEVEAEAEPEVADGDENHGHCVSYWARRAKAEGLEGSARGAFVSMVAGDPDAVSPKLGPEDSPGESCDFEDELDERLALQTAVGGVRHGRGKST